MTETTTEHVPTHDTRRSKVLERLRKKDPGYLAIKRSVRAAVVMPSVFGLAHLVSSDPQVSLFGAFGSFALLLLVDFPGRPRTRLVSYLALFVAGSCLIAVGTVASTHKVAAVVAMALVGFAVLFAGIVAPQVAAAATAAILIFVLPVAVAAPASAVGPRLAGWSLAGAFCISACMLVWPTPWHDDLRRRLSAAVSAVARMSRQQVEGLDDPETRAVVDASLALTRAELARTPYPSTGAATRAVALATLVGRVEWVAQNASRLDVLASPASSRVRAVIKASADTLSLSASLICDDSAHPVEDPSLADALRESAARLDHQIATELDAEVSTLIELGADHPARDSETSAGPGLDDDRDIASTLDPSFHARALGIATEMVADAALEAAGAEPTGQRPAGAADDDTSRLFWRRLTSYLSFRSVWFRNSVRGAAGLALAVAVVEVTNVEHGFWVVLGTLSVLRSNALGTGATALSAIGGTTVGFALGSAIMLGVSDHSVLLWVLLPFAVLVSGVAPSMISFAAGQAGFTVVVIILFNIIEPTGWVVGLTRVEDVAIGCAVSVVVGLLFWPRGATAALGRAFSDAFVQSSGYLADAVDRLTSPLRPVSTEVAERAAHSAQLRLDDAFRQFLAERGAKVVPIDTVADLFTGANRLRLGAYALATLPAPALEPGQPELEYVAIASAVLRDSYASNRRWYDEFGEMLADRRDSLDPSPAHDTTVHDALREAFEDARRRRRDDALRMMIQMLWAEELLETQREVQSDLAASADLFVRRRRQSRMI